MYRDLTDAQWAILKPLLPPPKPTGRPRADDRRTFNGICYVLRTGCRWADLPERYGSAATCHRRLARWMTDGTWERLWQTLLIMLSRQDKLRLEAAMPARSLRKKGGLGRDGGQAPARRNEALLDRGCPGHSPRPHAHGGLDP